MLSFLEKCLFIVEFGLLLRNSRHLGDASYENLLDRLNDLDLIGDYYKEEFKQLVLLASDRENYYYYD